MTTPRHPIYVISKGRWNKCLTARFLVADGVPFKLVVEPQESEDYAAEFGWDRLLVLPFSNLGLGGIPARNWVWEHAKASGAARHWILDDNISYMFRRWRAQRIRCNSKLAFSSVEDFTDRYENVAIAGLNYAMFVPDRGKKPPFSLNNHVYSCLLIDCALPYRWRGRYNEDTDLCLQVLAAGLCTVLVNAFLIQKLPTMTMKGGNADIYKGDGRLKMARTLERAWPYVASVDRRFRRPQHKVRDEWRKFDTQLKLREGVDLSKLPEVDDRGFRLKKVADVVKSSHLNELLSEFEPSGKSPGT